MKLKLGTTLLVLTIRHLVTGETSAPSQACTQACNSLRKELPSSFVSNTTSSNAYWAVQQASVQPACYVRPHNAEQVSTVVKTATSHKCQFAIRGAGHSDVKGASNSPGGITLDLGNMTEVRTFADQNTTRVGAGSIWGDVYTKLDKHNLTVIGGRETTVGVAGLTLGGGISYFSGQYGLACDNVRNYEVVLADGQIANVNSTSSYSDLYKSLRGGGNSFAVVTAFDLDTYAYNLMQGGLQIYSDSAAITENQIKAFVTFAHAAPTDHHATMFLSLDYNAGAFLWIDGLYYTLPGSTIPGTGHPAIYNDYYTAQMNTSRIESTIRTTTHGNLAAELGDSQPGGQRQQFHTGTFVANTTLLSRMVNIFREEAAKAHAAIKGTQDNAAFSANFAMQPLSKNNLRKQAKNGGNVLGLTVGEAPLMLLSMSWPWDDKVDDEVFIGGMDRVVSRSVAAAKELGLLNPFIYMNYASPGEPVVASYGSKNVEFMKRTSAKYDPASVFQKLVPGGFKLP